MVRSIGADKAIDYTQEDFTRNGRSYDLVLDNVGNRSVTDLMRTLSPTGTCVIVGFTSMGRLLQHTIVAPMVSRRRGKKILPASSGESDRGDLLFLKELLEAGKVAPVIDRRYRLSELPEAIEYVETGHARAKVVIAMEETGNQ
jgi:NADPH:quinone reductase-like Zn-dependent oxidoreductase